MLADLTGDGARPDDLQRAEDHLTRVARRVRALQLAPIAIGPCLDFATLMAAQQDKPRLAYVLRNFRRRSHQPEWMGWAGGQVAAAWERLDAAFTARRRTAS